MKFTKSLPGGGSHQPLENKGFTLIELLAVIVILAIIAVIATPIITNIIEDSKTSSFARSVEGIISGTNLDVSSKLDDDGYEYIIEDGKIDKLDSNINISNTKGYNGIIKYDSEAFVSYAIYNDKYCMIKTKDEEITKEYDGICDLPLYKEEILNGADPVLDSKMIPIYYDGNTAKVASLYNNWYSYEDRKWANAVILKDNPSKTYSANDILLEEDVIAYFVWIPRYEYTLYSDYGVNGTSSTTPGYIDIKFTSVNEKNYEGSASYIEGNPTNYRTQDAFKYGDDDLPGIWVGKFETTYGSNTTGYPNNELVDNITIKPSVTSLRNQSISVQFEQALKLGKIYNITYETTMLKSDEWNAVAILSQSLYGRCPSDDVCPEISINNSSNFITGSGFDTDLGVTTSTTMNITGIYDMSGGAYEYVMGVLSDSEGNPSSGKDSTSNSGYNGYLGKSGDYKTDGIDFPNNKYYNLYTETNTISGCNGKCYGLAEFNNWYSDYNDMVLVNNPWLVYGGCYANGSSAGIFSIHYSFGYLNVRTSFRISIRPI